MLDKLRNNIKSVVVQFIIVVVVAAFVGTIFLVWGHGGKSERKGGLLARVYDYEITYNEYQQEYMQLVQHYRRIYKDKWSEDLIEKMNLKDMALDNIINQYVLMHKAAEWGISVPHEEVLAHIKSLPVFQINGSFSPDVYQQRLSMARMTPEKFEMDILKHLLFMRIQERVSGGFKIDDDILWDRYEKEHEKIMAKYILVPSEKMTSVVQLSLDALRAYYEKNKENYIHPERRSIEYLTIRPRDFETDAIAEDEDIERYYNQYENRFRVPKQIKASHILLTVPPEATEEEEGKIKEKMLDILKKIEAGEDFSELAKANSECPSGKRGGDLGYFGKGKMDPAFEKSAFALNVGEVSQVIRSSFGYHIIKVEDIKPEHTKPLEEVRAEVIVEVKKQKAKEIAIERMQEIERKIYKGQSPREFAFEDRVSYQHAGPFTKEEQIPAFGRSKDIMDQIFDMEVGKLSRILESPKGIFLIKLTAVDPPSQMAYEEVEKLIENDLKLEKAKERAREEAEKIGERLKSGEDMDALAKAFDLQVFETGEFGRGGYIGGLGVFDDEQTQTVFSLRAGEVSPALENPKGYVVLKIEEKKGMDEEEFSKQKETLKAQLLQLKQTELFNAWIERVKREANIEILNKDFIS